MTADAYIDLGGTIRSRMPDRTLEWLQPVFRHVGLTRIARVTGLDHIGIAVSVAIRPMSRTLSASQGKGLSPELADASAAMESIELWHAENAPPAQLRGSYTALRANVDVLDPNALPSGLFPRVIDLQVREMGWLPACDLAGNGTCFVPRFACALQTDALRVEALSRTVDSTGLAGGNSIDEATCHALCEVIERDATACFSELSPGEQGERDVDLSTLDGLASDLLARIDRAGLSLRLWEQTSQVGVPAFQCVLEERADLRGLGAFGGYGAHLDPQIAVCRAITEAVQSRLTIIAGTRDDRPPAMYDHMRLCAGRQRPKRSPSRSFREAPAKATTGSFTSDVDRLVESLVRAGFSRVLRVNLTHEDIGVPVVGVLVPSAKVLLHD